VRPAIPFGTGLVRRTLDVRADLVVWVRSVVESYDGLGFLYGDGGGDIVLVTTDDQTTELDALIGALVEEAPAQGVRLRRE
jgi:hypothetical protein